MRWQVTGDDGLKDGEMVVEICWFVIYHLILPIKYEMRQIINIDLPSHPISYISQSTIITCGMRVDEIL